MKRILAVLIVLTVAAAPAPAAKKSAHGIRPGLFELGVYHGQPTGVSDSIDGMAAWGFGGAGSGNLVVAADYLFNFIDMGGGISLGARVPLGAFYIFRDVPLEISLEIVPGLYLIPATSFSMMGGIGVRYCF